MAPDPRILIVEDEQDFRETLVEIFTIQGYDVVALEGLAEFRRWFASGSFDVAVLDRTLPDGDGLDILKQIRQKSAVPVIVLTGMTQIAERIRGMDADADVYLAKPIDIRELLSIIKRMLRRVTSMHKLEVNCWQLDPQRWILKSPEGLSVQLTHREALLLKCFIGQSGNAVHRDDIVRTLGFNPMTFDLRRLDSMLFRFRKKLSDANMSGLDMHTVYGTGYSMHVSLQLIQDGN